MVYSVVEPFTLPLSNLRGTPEADSHKQLVMSNGSDKIIERINALKKQGKCVCKLSWPIHVSGCRYACELLDEVFEPIDRVEFEAADEASALNLRMAATRYC